MGYAQLAEGTVEKLRTDVELDRAIESVFPPSRSYNVQVERKYSQPLPSLLMQRGHLSEILVNVLQNAREAIHGEGRVWVEAYAVEGSLVVIRMRDNGEGIAPHRLPRIFDAYFSTKEKGTGLGLSIVKHNTEIYGGTVTVESELGKGSTFIIKLPTRTFMKLQK
jgi:signal transduction histidine kinase